VPARSRRAGTRWHGLDRNCKRVRACGARQRWTGAQAQERGLVDTLGSDGDALWSAATRAKLGAGYRGAYIERDSSRFERAQERFGTTAAQAVKIEVKLGLLPAGLPAGAVANVTRELNWLSEMGEGRKPYAAITHCLCEMP
jgi:protease-4